jgi:hypothetical protein
VSIINRILGLVVIDTTIVNVHTENTFDNWSVYW